MSTTIYIYASSDLSLKLACFSRSKSVEGCSECLSSKTAGEHEPEAYPLGYVEDSCELRTPLAGIINSRLVGDDLGC